MVDDDLVHQEKIGISNYFWSFPSEAAVKLDNDLTKLQTRLNAGATDLASLEEQLEKSKEGKDDTEERRQLYTIMKQFEGDCAEKTEELERYAASDPDRFEALSTLSLSCPAPWFWPIYCLYKT